MDLKSLFISCSVTIAIVLISLLLALILTSELSSHVWPKSAVLEHPWNQSNLAFYIDNGSVSPNEIPVYTHNARIGFRWWEREGEQYLGYGVNFSEVIDPLNANIIINWRIENYTPDKDTLGHTFINTTNQRGDLTCDTYNPPFIQCNISIKQGLDDSKMQEVIKHEIGHTFSLKHSYNTNDFLVRILFDSNYLNTPMDIMIDDEVFIKVYFLMVSLISTILLIVNLILTKIKILYKILFILIYFILLGFFTFNVIFLSKYENYLSILINIVLFQALILFIQNILHYRQSEKKLPDLLDREIQ